MTPKTLANLTEFESTSRIRFLLELVIIASQALAAVWLSKLFREIKAWAAFAIGGWGLRLAHRAERALLHPFSDAARRVPVYLRGLFVPGGEFFSRAPEDPRNPSSGVTVHKWTRIPEVFSAPDVQAAATVLRLLTSENPEVTTGLLAGDAGRQTWSDDAIAIGPHYLTLQVLDGCEPRLVALRQPAAFRLLPSGQVLEAKEGLDFGLVYKGVRAATHRTFMVVMGLGDAGTVAGARFLELHATTPPNCESRFCWL